VAELGDAESGRETTRALLTGISVKLDGQTASRSTLQRRRAVLHCCLEYALEAGLLAANPLDGLKFGIPQTAVSRAVNPRHVPSLPQARRLLAAVKDIGRVRGARLHAFFATLYFAGMRPAEVRNLHTDDLHLPEAGWGTATLSGAAPEVGGEWTDNGELYDTRGLKHRAQGTIRLVPLPPELVAILRAHLATIGAAPDGRVFWSGDTHQPVSGDTYREVWRLARQGALSPAELASGLAVRPYDLRHGNASLLLAAGVPATEVARRLGHTVAVLHLVYAHWFEGLTESANSKIDTALAADQPETGNIPGPGPATGQHDQPTTN
jgi:integrase